MPWNSTFPLGTVSVKANRTIGQENTTYIENTMGISVLGTNTVTTRDHFWAVDPNLDGRHRFIQSQGFTVASAPADPVIGTQMDGVNYLKLTNGTVQNFYRNAQGIYQTSPAVIKGTATLNDATFATIAAIPANCYGEIILYVSGTLSANSTQRGYFVSNASKVQGWSSPYPLSGVSATSFFLAVQLGNAANAPDLNLKGKVVTSPPFATWEYIITYRAL